MSRMVAAVILFVTACAGSSSSELPEEQTRLTDFVESVTSSSLPAPPPDATTVATTYGAGEGAEAAGAGGVDGEPASLVEQAQACIAGSGGEITGDGISEVLSCFDRIRQTQAPLGLAEAEALTAACADQGGGACTELLLRSTNQDDQLFGMACGGREPAIPCSTAPTTTTTTTPVVTDVQLVDAAARGNVILYSISEIDRPIYGWKDFASVTYCADGTFFLESTGERRTVLDNTEYRSDFGQGAWLVVEAPGGTVAVQHQFTDGRAVSLTVTVLPGGGFDLGPAVSAQVQGPAGC